MLESPTARLRAGLGSDLVGIGFSLFLAVLPISEGQWFR